MITRNTMVTLDYRVTDTDGNMVDDGSEPLVYLHGGYEDIFAPIEEALEGKAVGDSITVKLHPGQAFGEYDPELVQVVAVEELPQPLEKGMQIEATPDGDGEGEPVYLTVTDIADGKAVLDGNHPLAGLALVFACTVADARTASPHEIAERRLH